MADEGALHLVVAREHGRRALRRGRRDRGAIDESRCPTPRRPGARRAGHVHRSSPDERRRRLCPHLPRRIPRCRHAGPIVFVSLRVVWPQLLIREPITSARAADIFVASRRCVDNIVGHAMADCGLRIELADGRLNFAIELRTPHAAPSQSEPRPSYGSRDATRASYMIVGVAIQPNIIVGSAVGLVEAAGADPPKTLEQSRSETRRATWC